MNANRFVPPALLLLSLMGGCIEQPTDVLGTAYVAPATINLRRELTEKNGSAAVLKHGEPVQILELRRRYVRIRTEHGVEGWIDSAQLLTTEQMEFIKQEMGRALKLPSEGSATVFEALNVHIDPSRQSPAFARIPDNGSVEVLAHKLEPKVTGPPKPQVFVFPQAQASGAKKSRRGKKGKEVFHLPPPPPPPKPPDNWVELSALPAVKPVEPKDKTPKEPVVMEDWTLVRTKDKECGWVLSRNLIMSIPDDVAQYAEGKRITSYFELGTVIDEDKGARHNWLWTTASESESYDFDAWRVFIWSRHRHRYETSYRQRNLEGYFPVHVDPAENTSPQRTFEIVTKDDDNELWRRTYGFDGTLVRLTGKEPYDASAPVDRSPASVNASTNKEKSTAKSNWLHKSWDRLKGNFGKIH